MCVPIIKYLVRTKTTKQHKLTSPDTNCQVRSKLLFWRMSWKQIPKIVNKLSYEVVSKDSIRMKHFVGLTTSQFEVLFDLLNDTTLELGCRLSAFFSRKILVSSHLPLSILESRIWWFPLVRLSFTRASKSSLFPACLRPLHFNQRFN